MEEIRSTSTRKRNKWPDKIINAERSETQVQKKLVMMIAPSSRHPSTHKSRSLPAATLVFYSHLTANHRSITVPTIRSLSPEKRKEKREKRKMKAKSYSTKTIPLDIYGSISSSGCSNKKFAASSSFLSHAKYA